MNELSITQEYLLLAVNERGRFSPLNPQQPVCLVAAALAELEKAGCVAFFEGRIGLAGALPGHLRCLKPLYDFLDRPRPVSPSLALRDFGPDGAKLAELEEAVGESLQDAHLAAPQRALAGRMYYLPAAGQAAARLQRLLAALADETGPSPAQAALAMLLCQSGVIAQKAGAASAARAEQALAALVRAHTPAGEAALAMQAAVDRVNEALGRAL